MELPGWQRLYLDALLRGRYDRLAQYETVEHFASVVGEPADGVQELLLHRTVAGIESLAEVLKLLDILRTTQWRSYEPRLLARIANTEAVIQHRPEIKTYFEDLRERAGYTTYSLKDWRLISEATDLDFPMAPVWASNIISIEEILPDVDLRKMSFEQLASVLNYFHGVGVRTFQIGVLTLVGTKESWANTLHRALMAPYIEIENSVSYADQMVVNAPTSQWSPHWKLNASASRTSNWDIVEAHTGQRLCGLGATGIFTQISGLLAVSGLLKEGIQLSPIDDDDLVMPVNPQHPIWGFRRREFAAGGTSYQVHDIRAIALGILETLPPIRRVSIFRSRLSFHLVTRRWRQRASASIVTDPHGYYAKVIRAAKLLGQNRFTDVLSFVSTLDHRFEPIFRFFHDEAATSLTLLRRVDQVSKPVTEQVADTERILCVTHASVPDQSGGYAIRGHGVLKSLRDYGIDITAVTRPGFPNGTGTEASTVVVDGVPYHRLPATAVTRQHGEVQYLYSFIEPFKTLFREQGAKAIHVRSTFLIALPALIAARELELKVLYEVSGLWELVYHDREESSDLLKRSAFAELAETITMTNVDQLVVMNEAVERVALARGVDSARIQIAHNAVDVEKFQPLDPPRNTDFTVGYLGSFQDYEGLDDIIDVVKLLRERKIFIRVLMVGDGLQFKHVRKRIVSEGLKENIVLTGRVPHDRVLEYYAQMDILVYPRRSTGATETITPLKPFEALALAKPIIVSDVAPLQEIVGTEERGLVFTSGSVEDFARCIEDLMKNPSRGVALGRAGRAWVEEHRSWDNVVGAFVSAYGKMGLLNRVPENN